MTFCCVNSIPFSVWLFCFSCCNSNSILSIWIECRMNPLWWWLGIAQYQALGIGARAGFSICFHFGTRDAWPNIPATKQLSPEVCSSIIPHFWLELEFSRKTTTQGLNLTWSSSMFLNFKDRCVKDWSDNSFIMALDITVVFSPCKSTWIPVPTRTISAAFAHWSPKWGITTWNVVPKSTYEKLIIKGCWETLLLEVPSEQHGTRTLELNFVRHG